MPEPDAHENVAATQLTSHELAELHEAAKAWSRVPKARVEVGSGSIHPDLDIAEGHDNVRVLRSRKGGFELVEPGWLQATPRASRPKTGFAQLRRKIRAGILGPPMSTRQLAHERLTKVKALAVLSSDALSSVAYATEQIGTVFVAAGIGALAFSYDLWIMGAILFLLAAVVLSYRQTIKAYPKGGGSYIVAKDNLGAVPGLIAAAALMTDYVLTVAVSVSSGWDSVVSFAPSLEKYRIAACVCLVILIAVGNLRGIRESGSIFAAPTYLFILAIFLMLGTILVKLATGNLHPGNTAVVGAAQNVSIVLILQAFASGCSALTGVEAISDGVPAFKAPEWRNARTTLTIMGSVLGAMFLGITVLAHTLGLHAMNSASPGYKTIIAQLANSAFGTGGLYIYVLLATTAILVLAANTSFSDFPRLFFFLARDDYAPHQFGRLGDRLAFSNGIIVLAMLSILLLVGFGGKVEALIPLYAVGVFLAFTMSQAGMVTRWIRRKEPGWKHSLPLNFVGMVMTAIVFIVAGASKFREGAYIVIIIIPIMVALFLAIHRHYRDIATQIETEIPISPEKLKPVCIVPFADFNSVALQSLAMARTISDSVIAVHVCDSEDHIARLRQKWEAWGNHVPLEIVETPYRSFLRPLIAYIDAIDRQRSDDTMVIILPELVATRWWHQLIHNQTALRLKGALLFRPGTVVISVPYHLKEGPHSHSRGRKKHQ